MLDHLISINNESWKSDICSLCKFNSNSSRECNEFCLPIEILIRLMSTSDNKLINKINVLRKQAINSDKDLVDKI